MSDTIEMYVGDSLPQIDCTYDGVDITGYSFALHIKYDSAVTTIAGTITDAAAGEFAFAVPSASRKVGTWQAEIEVTDAGGDTETWGDLRLKIKQDIL